MGFARNGYDDGDAIVLVYAEERLNTNTSARTKTSYRTDDHS